MSGAGAPASVDRIPRVRGFLPHPIVRQATAPPCHHPSAIASPSSSTSSRATPPWSARGSAQPWYRIARRPERSRGRLQAPAARAQRGPGTRPLTSTSDRPTRAWCPVYGALPAHIALAAGPTQPDRTNDLGARCSTDAGILASCASTVTPRRPVPSLGRLSLPVKPVRCIAGNMRPNPAVMES